MNASDAAKAGKIADLCATELTSLLWFANLFLWVAAIAAIVVTVVAIATQVVALFANRSKAAASDESGGGAASALIDSLRGLVTALAQAPAWFAIFLAAVLLLWIAPTYFGNKCILAPSAPSAPAGNANIDTSTGDADNMQG